MRLCTKVTTSWLLITSHTPSQASTKNLSSSVMVTCHSKACGLARADVACKCFEQMHNNVLSACPVYLREHTRHYHLSSQTSSEHAQACHVALVLCC